MTTTTAISAPSSSKNAMVLTPLLGRARDQTARLAEPRPLDAQERVLRHLADLRAAVLGGIEKAPNLDALRRLLQQLFEKVHYLPAGHPWLDVADSAVTEMPGAALWPWLREGAIEDYIDGEIPVIRKAVVPVEELSGLAVSIKLMPAWNEARTQAWA